MRDEQKTKQQLIEELAALRRENEKLRGKSAQQDLLWDRERLVALFEGLSYGVSVSVPEDGDFVLLHANSMVAAMNGTTLSEMLGRRLGDMFPIMKENGFLEAMGRVHATGEPQYLPPRLHENNLQCSWRQYNMFCLPDGAVVCVAEDVTQHVRDARQLRARTQVLQATLDATLDGIWEYRVRDGAFISNDRLPEMLGYSRKALARFGPFCQGIIHPDDIESFNESIAACLESGEYPLEHEVRLLNVDGDWRWMLTRASLIDSSDDKTKHVVGAFTDITARKEEEARRRADLEVFSRAFESAQTIMLLVDPDSGQVVEANKMALDYYGYPKDILETMRMSDINVMSEDEVAREMARARRAERTHFNFRHELASGEIRDVEVRSGPVVIEGRNLLFSIIHDITEERRAIEALRRSEAKLNGIFRAAPVGVGEVNNRVLGHVNQRLADILGYTPEELEGVDARILYPSDEEYQRVARIKHPQVKAHGIGTMETLMRRKNGKDVQVILSSSWKDESDHSEGMIFTVQDITGLKHAQEQAREARGYLHSVIDSMPSAIFCVDEVGKVTLWNQQALEMPLCDGPLLGRKMSALLKGFPSIDGMLDTVLQARQPVVRKALQHECQGRIRFWDVLMYPFASNGIKGSVVRLEDVTDRVYMEEAMIQSEKMLSLGGLAAGMAHEINNPLGGIIQGAQNVERRLAPDLSANIEIAGKCGLDLQALAVYMEKRKIPVLLEGVKTSGGRAARIVSSMLDFSRKNESRMAPVDLAACIDETISLARSDYDLKKHYDFKKIGIEKDLPPDLPFIRCAKTEIQQVLLNLLTNSAHAMVQCQEADFFPNIRICARKGMGEIVIEVEDNGPGIDPQLRKRIFEPFFTTKAPGEGTGLGLSVSYFIITRNHKGALTVDSAPGRGSRFTISLPV